MLHIIPEWDLSVEVAGIEWDPAVDGWGSRGIYLWEAVVGAVTVADEVAIVAGAVPRNGSDESTESQSVTVSSGGCNLVEYECSLCTAKTCISMSQNVW